MIMKRTLIGLYFLFFVALFLSSCEDSTEDQTVRAEITQFSVWDQKAVNHQLHVNNVTNTISTKQELPAYVNLTRLIAEFKLNRQDAVLKVNDKVQRSGQGELDFTNEIVYDLYVGNEKQKSYKVNISKGELTNTFRTFTFAGKQMIPFQPVINDETGEITNTEEIPLNIDISSLQPEFITSETGAVVKVNGIVQTSGVAKHDFSKPVVYVIEGEDGTSKEYTVRIKQGNEYYLENPIISGSYADPTVIRVGKEFFVYVTGGLVRGYRSSDLVNWNRIGATKSEVFKNRPAFTDDDVKDTGMWAPDINYFDGKYVMYYSISKWGGGATCGIGIGVSEKPEGPFSPPPGNPNGKLFVSGEIGVHNSIDPCFVEENGKRYLFWGSFYGIYMTELTSDGMAVKDMNNKKKVAGKSFEATYIHKRGNYYYLFASIGGCCDGMNSSYKIVVGRSTQLEGPYLNKNGVDMNSFDAWDPTHYNPLILKGNDMFGGPGHNARIITDDIGVDWMLYHSYVFEGDGSRSLMIDKVTWDAEGWPIVGNGTPSFALKEVPFFN